MSTPDAPGLTCPTCHQGHLVTGSDPVATCPTCGHRAAAALVAEAMWLRGEQQRLVNRLTWVEQQIAAGQTSVPPGTAAPGTAPAPSGAPLPTRAPVTAQGLLLGGGALLLVVAAIVFTAVAWNKIGPAGQVVTMLGVIGLLSGVSHLMRRRYRSTAEALAVAAAAVAAVALLAAPGLGLGAEWMRTRDAAWATVALLVVAAFSVVMARLGGLTAWRIAAVVAMGASAVAATFAIDEPDGGPQPLAVAVLAAVSAGVLLASSRRPDLPREAVYLGGGLAVISVLFGVGDLERGLSWALTWAVIGGAATLVARTPAPSGLPRPLKAIWVWPAAMAAGIAVGQVAARLAAHSNLTPDVALVLLGVLGCAIFGTGQLVVRRCRPWSIVAGSGAITCWLLALPAAESLRWSSRNAANPGNAEPVSSLHAGAGSLFFALIAITLVLVALLVPVAAVREALLLPWAGAILGIVALWILWVDRDVDLLENWTLPAAGLLLLAGLVSARGVRRLPLGELVRTTPSLWLVGPALAMALLPSAVATWPDVIDRHHLLRTLVVLVVAAVIAVAGGLGKVLAPLFVGLAGLLLVALGQVWQLADMVPRWVTLTLVALVLLAAGFSLEELTRRGRQVRRAVHEFR